MQLITFAFGILPGDDRRKLDVSGKDPGLLGGNQDGSRAWSALAISASQRSAGLARRGA